MVIAATQRELFLGPNNREAQAEKVRAMAVVHSVDLMDTFIAGGDTAQSLDLPGMA